MRGAGHRVDPRPDWTPEKLALLKQLYPTASWATLYDALDMTESAIVYQARKLGLIRTFWRSGTWDDPKRVERLEKLWTQGYSAGRIAQILGHGITRNMVISKVHRMGLSRNRATKERVQTLSKRERAEQRKNSSSPWCRTIKYAKPPRPIVQKLKPGDVPRKPLVDLEPHECRWPVGDPLAPGFGFCAAERVPGIPYCAAHALRAYDPSQPASRAATLQAASTVESETQTEKEVETAE